MAGSCSTLSATKPAARGDLRTVLLFAGRHECQPGEGSGDDDGRAVVAHAGVPAAVAVLIVRQPGKGGLHALVLQDLVVEGFRRPFHLARRWRRGAAGASRGETRILLQVLCRCWGHGRPAVAADAHQVRRAIGPRDDDRARGKLPGVKGMRKLSPVDFRGLFGSDLLSAADTTAQAMRKAATAVQRRRPISWEKLQTRSRATRIMSTRARGRRSMHTAASGA